MKKRITPNTLKELDKVLAAKGLPGLTVPAEFQEQNGLKSSDLDDLTEVKGQSLLAWLEGLPDDQPVEPASPAEIIDATNETSDQPEDDGQAKDDIRKAEDTLMIKRPLNPEEQQENMDALFELEARRTTLEFELDGFKNQVKGCQKEIDGIDQRTYKLIREIKENEVEEPVETLRVTNHSEGMIYWYHRDTGELLREKPIEVGEQLPLDLAGDASNHNEIQEDTAAEDPDFIPASDSFAEPDQIEAQA